MQFYATIFRIRVILIEEGNLTQLMGVCKIILYLITKKEKRIIIVNFCLMFIIDF